MKEEKEGYEDKNRSAASEKRYRYTERWGKMEIGANATNNSREPNTSPPVLHKRTFNPLGNPLFCSCKWDLHEIMPRLTDFICCLYTRENGGARAQTATKCLSLFSSFLSSFFYFQRMLRPRIDASTIRGSRLAIIRVDCYHFYSAIKLLLRSSSYRRLILKSSRTNKLSS